MKIKTITCHDVYNAGASLQAYALVTYLRELGHEAEIIDYKPNYLSGHYRLWGGVNPKYDFPFLREAYCMAKLPTRLAARFSKNKKAFDDFTLKYLPLTKRYTSNEALKKDPPAADVYFAGSDQIWNTLFPNGKDPAFYLDFAPHNKIRASYAASFATDHIDSAWKAQISIWLKSLDYISVRESSGISVLHDLGIHQCRQVLDPVFLLGIDKWSKYIYTGNSFYSDPYILVYDFDNNQIISEFAESIAQEKKCRILYFPTDFKSMASFLGPVGFLNAIYYADVVISNSFHATAFSIIFQKDFWVFNRHDKINARISDLVSILGLRDRYNWNYGHASSINYEIIQNRINKLILGSKLYIDKVILGAPHG